MLIHTETILKIAYFLVQDVSWNKFSKFLQEDFSDHIEQLQTTFPKLQIAYILENIKREERVYTQLAMIAVIKNVLGEQSLR